MSVEPPASESQPGDGKPLAPPGHSRLSQQLAFHLDNLPLAAMVLDPSLRVARWNEKAEELFGWPAAEALGRRPGAGWDIVSPDEWESLAGRLRSGRERTVEFVSRSRTRSGEPLWVEWRNSVLVDRDGTLASVLSVATDVTGRQAAHDAITRSEAWMRDALGSARMLGWELDIARGKWTTSADLTAFYGLPDGLDYTDPKVALTAVHPDDVPAVLEGRRRAIETGEPMRYEFRGRYPAPDGSVRWFGTRGQVLRDAAGNPTRLAGVTTDITERKRAEESRAALDRQLLDAQKWESLGVLAGGVAHDFNNILTVVLGCAGLARKGVSPSSPTAGYLGQIEQAARRAADLCRQLLAYTGRGHVPAVTTDLNQLIRSSSALLAVPVSRSSGVRFDLEEGLPVVRGDPAQIRQVVMNLVMNAAEAVAEAGGEVRVVTGAVEVPDGAPAGYHLPPAPGRYVRLAVSDTGPGMPPDVAARMFDPFFTTKFAGRGLGLSAALGIMKSHGGAIRVMTGPATGTTVEALWPASGGANAALPAAPPARRSAGKALVVDDEVYVREVTALTVQDLGYEPLLASDGPSALAVYRENIDEVRVAVLDVVMPGMSGDQLLEQLRALAPELPAVLVSGFVDRRGLALDPRSRTEFLQKPFHPEELAAVVKRVAAT